MKLLNDKVMQTLRRAHPRTLTANQIVTRTGLTFSTVRDTLNRAREKNLVDRELGIGDNGGVRFDWYWCGGDDTTAWKEPASWT